MNSRVKNFKFQKGQLSCGKFELFTHDSTEDSPTCNAAKYHGKNLFRKQFFPKKVAFDGWLTLSPFPNLWRFWCRKRILNSRWARWISLKSSLRRCWLNENWNWGKLTLRIGQSGGVSFCWIDNPISNDISSKIHFSALPFFCNFSDVHTRNKNHKKYDVASSQRIIWRQ